MTTSLSERIIGRNVWVPVRQKQEETVEVFPAPMRASDDWSMRLTQELMKLARWVRVRWEEGGRERRGRQRTEEGEGREREGGERLLNRTGTVSG